MRNLLLCSFFFWIACVGPGAQQPAAEQASEDTETSAANADAPPATERPAARGEGAAATSPDAAATTLRARCCAQCSSAANQDPAGRDISQKPCLEYIGYVVNGAAPVDEACSKWFDANRTFTVSACF